MYSCRGRGEGERGIADSTQFGGSWWCGDGKGGSLRVDIRVRASLRFRGTTVLGEFSELG